MLRSVLDDAGLLGADQQLPPAVHVKHGTNRFGKKLHFYLNYSSLPQTVSYAYAPGEDLLSHSSVSHDAKLTLQPWDSAIVEEQ